MSFISNKSNWSKIHLKGVKYPRDGCQIRSLVLNIEVDKHR